MHNLEKPLPLPPDPVDRLQARKPASTAILDTTESPSATARPPLAGSQSFQRPRKRVLWGNKGCIIALPLENDFGRTTTRESYLKPEDVTERMQEWETKGFNTKGFVLASPTTASMPFVTHGQSRAIHPDIEDETKERSRREYRVSIPDKLEWEAYVKHLNEETLRALGVSYCEDETASRRSPAPSLMSRGASSQSSSMLVSPPLASTSMGTLSAPTQLPEQATEHAHPAKMGHFPRYSVASPLFNEKTQISGGSPESQTPVSRVWSPQQHVMASHPISRIGSPLANTSAQGASNVVPYMSNDTGRPPVQTPNDTHMQMQHQYAQLQAHQLQQQQQQLSYLLRPQSQAAIHSPQTINHHLLHPVLSQPSIVTPMPDGHLHNPSETLQRNFDKAQASHESSKMNSSSFSRQVQADNIEPKDDSETPIVRDIAKASVGAEHTSDSIPGKESELPKTRTLALDDPTDEPKDLQSKGTSVSKLNVNAPEFKFEPKGTSAPNLFSFLGNQQLARSTAPESSGVQPLPGRLRAISVGQSSNLNVAAPVFVPQFAPQARLPTRDFNFSHPGPSFNPIAPAFKPHDHETATNSDLNYTGTGGIHATEEAKRIFGRLTPQQNISRPKQSSQALPILKPDGSTEESNAETDGQEDESGRITQPDGRQKRARRVQDDGDQVPLFASPNCTPWLEGRDDRAAYFDNDTNSESENLEPSTLEAATDLLEEVIDEMAASEVSSLMQESTSEAGRGKSDASSSSSTSMKRMQRHRRLHNPTPQEVAGATREFLAHSSSYQQQFQHQLEEHASQRSPCLISGQGSESKPLQHDIHDNKEQGADSRSSYTIRQDILDGVRYVQPSYDEIDAVMQDMNDDSDLGIVRRTDHHPQSGQMGSRSHSSAFGSPRHTLIPNAHIRSDAPSPSPNRLKEAFQYLPPTDSESADTIAKEIVLRNARFSPSYRPSKEQQVRQLNSPGSSPPSDWNDVFSSGDEDKLQSKASLWNPSMHDVVGAVIQRRLGPIEKTLSSIQEALVHPSSGPATRRPRSAGAMEISGNSDADDEDDEAVKSQRLQSRLGSRQIERGLDQLNTSITEIAIAQRNAVPATQFSEVLDVMRQLKVSMQQLPPVGQQNPTGDLKGNVEETGGKQMRGKSAPITSTSQAIAAEKSNLQIAGLESMLKVAEDRADDEMKARRSIEDALADNQRLLRAALQEAAEQRESAEATERSLQEYHSEQHQLIKRMASLEGSQEHMERMAGDLSEKNTALEGTLAEYRLSSDKWRTDIDDARHENKDLRRHLSSLNNDKENLVSDCIALRAKFDHLQEDMHRSSKELAADQVRWVVKEQEHNDRLEVLSARLEAEARIRERLEAETERLEAHERESIKARFLLEQTQRANAHLDTLIGQLRAENHEHQNKASRLERDLHAAKETHTMEIHRTRSEMKVDIESSKSQVNVVRAELQHFISQLEKQVADAKVSADTAQERYQLMLDQASESRLAALQAAAEAKDTALQKHRLHEQTLDEMTSGHQHALESLVEEKQRSETYFGNRLSLADEKATLLQDRITHLEDKLKIAKQAASAAIQAAQTKTSTSAGSGTSVALDSGLNRDISSIPEKVSPQALRESILVLQEQLQAREARIEILEGEVLAIDTSLPSKLQDARNEIVWLRELLGVRVDDLQDIISILSSPAYDRERVKDAAIRLKANLQMEQLEKERALASGSSAKPSLSSISNLASSPRSLPLAAAAAWGNWRKGREATTALGRLSEAENRSDLQKTPSKSSAPQGLFAGFMTPPSTTMRLAPGPNARSIYPASSTAAEGKRPHAGPSTPRRSFPNTQTHDPVTPPLMRKASYDLDAHEEPDFDHTERDVSNAAFGGEYEIGVADEEPFGPKIGTFAS